MPAKATPERYLRFRRMLARWYRRHGRDLPWRRTRNPYRVLVSEIMLQQTQVSRVEAYYTRFLKQFPSVRHLATASPSMVREAWEGLGYYRRAANLHRLAREVVSRRNGVIPADPAELVQLPGVGRYTAGAVASFAYERITPAVDTNVARVIRRAFHPRTGNGSSDRRIWATAAALVPRQRQSGVALQSSDHGVGRSRLHREGGEVRALSGTDGVREREKGVKGKVVSPFLLSCVYLTSDPPTKASSPNAPQIIPTTFCRLRSSSK
jgi:A/G-specific adenine glycosylase